LLAILVAVAFAAPAHAEDLKGKWYFGGNLSFLSTTDSVRSNAQIITGPLGDDGIPFTGDPNEEQGCTSNAGNSFCDPRPDDLLGRESTIEETFKYDVTAGFGLTSWLNLQLDASYFRGNVGPIDVFLRDTFPVQSNPVDPTSVNAFDERETVIPVQAGELTEIPVSLSAMIRFRKDSPLNPYIGVGAGIIFAKLDRSGDVDDLNARVNAMRIRGATNEFERNILPLSLGALAADGLVPNIWPVLVDVDNAFEWHLSGGLEYFRNDRLSLIFDAKYTFADQDVTMDLGGEDQVDLTIYSEKLFRPDGSLKFFNDKGVAPNTLCRNTPLDSNGNPTGVGCDPGGSPTQHVNPEKMPGITCPNVGDFDNDGQTDACYDSVALPNDPRGDVVVQGGKISLTGFAIAVGVRFHW